MPDRPDMASAGPDPRHAGSRLTIDLDALAANWKTLAARSAPARTAAVVKADAYGLGMARVAPALWSGGCRDFFVALPHEGFALRDLLPAAAIHVLVPMPGEAMAEELAAAGLVPVLNTPDDIDRWGLLCARRQEALPCAIHVDTGMNRLGLTEREIETLAAGDRSGLPVKPGLLVSHLACADEPDHPLNARQLEIFQRVARLFEGSARSLANSAGIFLGPGYLFDLVRPGIALYGGRPVPEARMRTVVTAEAKVIQVRRAPAGETVSYGATVTLRRDTVIAVCAVGYADGLHRAASGTGVALRETSVPPGCGFAAGRRVPLLGRITMDSIMFDVTDCGEGAVRPGDFVELFGPNITLDEAASAAGTISYELLTSLGTRYHRLYSGPRQA